MPPDVQAAAIEPPERLLPVHVDSIDPQVLDLDLWIRYPDQPRPVLYRGSGLKFESSDLHRLREGGIEFLYIPAVQHARYRKLLARKLDSTFRSGNGDPSDRAKIIRKTCARMIEEVLVLPGVTEPVQTVLEVSQVAVDWLNSDPQGFSFLLDMSAHDYYTATHMVNVGVGCALLCKKIRADDNVLLGLVTQGGLLHDLGKRSIPVEILNKEGKLSVDEFALIRQHPTMGVEELGRHPGISPIVLEMACDHHERLDGKGYPASKSGPQIGFAARICAVVDVFDAMMSARPYRSPIHPRDALECMLKGAGTHFDPDILFAWRDLVADLIAKTPARTAGAREGAARPSLNQIAGADNAAASRPLTGHARVLDRGNVCINSFPVTVSHLSAEGATIRTRGGLTPGQTIALVFEQPTIVGAARRAYVDSVVSAGPDWVATVSFNKAARKRAA